MRNRADRAHRADQAGRTGRVIAPLLACLTLLVHTPAGMAAGAGVAAGAGMAAGAGVVAGAGGATGAGVVAGTDSGESPGGPGRAALRWNNRVDLPVTLGALAVGLGLDFNKEALAPDDCRWCDADASGADNLNGFDRTIRDALLSSDPDDVDQLSNITLLASGAVSFGVNALAARDGEAWTNSGIILEALSLSVATTNIIKFTAGRERPFVHVLPPEEKPLTERPGDNNLSFTSGHTSEAFSLAVAGGRVASIRGYPAAPWIWVAGLGAATATGVSRIMADRHYATDVLAGAAIGGLFGWVVPGLHRGPADAGSGAARAGAARSGAARSGGDADRAGNGAGDREAATEPHADWRLVPTSGPGLVLQLSW